MELKAIIFDVDGTLAETEELHRVAFNKTFKKLKMEWYWDARMYGKLLKISGGKERISHYMNLLPPKEVKLSKEQIEFIHKEKTDLYSKSLVAEKIKLRPGVAAVIEEAKRRNIKLAIATATSFINVENLIASAWDSAINDIFDAIATGDEISENKPSPEVYYLVLKRLCIKAEHCIAIEDSLNGLMSAKGAGLKTIIVPSFYTKGEDFSLAEAVLTSLLNFEF